MTQLFGAHPEGQELARRFYLDHKLTGLSLPDVKVQEGVAKTLKREPILDRYNKLFNVRPELKSQARHNPVHWKKT